MSSSVGYYVSPVDLAAQRRRELRGEIAALRARLDALRRRASALGAETAQGTKVRPRAGSDVAELETMATILREAIQDASRQVDVFWTRSLSKQIASKGQRRATVTPLAAARADAVDAKAKERQDLIRQRAIADVERLLRDAGARCDPADLSGLTTKFQLMSTMDDTEAVRSAALEIAIGVREAVERHKLAERHDHKRAVLLELLHDAEPADRDRLSAAVRDADDPEPLSEQVHQAVERADLARHRRSVADAAAAALVEAGCVLGEDFATLLVDTEEAVVRLGGEADDYGLLVRLPAEGTRLLTAMVRSADAHPDDDEDVRVQQDFCDSTLPGLVESLREGGVELDPAPFLRTEPGQRPTTPLPPERLPRQRSTTRHTTRSRTPAVRPVLRERRHGG